jgi:serine/threonine-protein kinase RsbW
MVKELMLLRFPFALCPFAVCLILDTRAARVLNCECFRFAFPSLTSGSACLCRRVLCGERSRSATVTEQTTELTLPSRIEAIAEAAAKADEVAERLRLSEDAAFGLDMAVREAVTNAVLHGNKQDESKPVEIAFTDTGSELVVTVRDRGTGFDPASVDDPTAEQNLLKASGRGLLFMRNFMDTVEWSPHPEGGTIVRMTKKK